MGFKKRYPKYKQAFLDDERMCQENKIVFEKHFEWHERKLKSINDLRELDEACYKTLYRYVSMFKNTVKWFKYKPLEGITKTEIRNVYEDLEDGKILNFYGKPFEDRASYYSNVFKGKLFKMIKKFDYAEEVLEFSRPEKNKGKVRFFPEEDFKKILTVAMKFHHKLFLQLYWDIGENVMTIVRMQKKDCERVINQQTNEPEYLVNLPKEKIKRSRTSRTEITNYPETTELLDLHFKQGKRKFIPNPEGESFQHIYDEDEVKRKVRGNWIIVPFKDEDYLFDFGQKQAEKIFRRCVEITGVKCSPNGERPSLKDIRSSMACHLLKQGWSIDEVKGRMGHRPSSKAIDRYVTYLALDKHKAKQRMYRTELEKHQEEIKILRGRERHNEVWIENQKSEIGELKALMQVYISKVNQLEQIQTCRL